MAQVTLPYTLTPGTPENVNNLMSNLTALRDGVNTIDTAQIASGAVTSAKLGAGAVDTTALAANAVTAAKIDATVAGYLGLTSGATTRRWSVNDTTERTTTSTSYTDVTGATMSIDDVAGNLTIVTVSCEIRNSGTSDASAEIFCDVPLGNGAPALNSTSKSTTTTTGAIYTVSWTGAPGGYQSGGVPMLNAGSTYQKQSQILMYCAASTRTTTAKLRFVAGAGTTYIRNVKLSAWTITPQ